MFKKNREKRSPDLSLSFMEIACYLKFKKWGTLRELIRARNLSLREKYDDRNERKDERKPREFKMKVKIKNLQETPTC